MQSTAGSVARGTGRTWASVPRGPWWRAAPEVGWFLLVVAYVVLVPPDAVSSGTVEYGVLVAVAVVCAGTALVRRWRPGLLDPIALGVTAVPVVFVALRAADVLWPLWPLQMIVTGAVQPVLLAALVRRCPLPLVLPGVAVAAAGVRLDAGGTSFTRDLVVYAFRVEPSRPMLVITSLLLVSVPLAAGLVLRFTDAGREVERLARVRAEERLQTARELHDTVANHITGILLCAQGIARTPGLPPGARQGLESIEDAGRRALVEMRHLVGTLRSDTAPVTAGAAHQAPARTPAAVVRATVGDAPDVRLCIDAGPRDEAGTSDPDVLDALHHVTTEALTNARRYRSPDSLVEIELAVPRPDAITLQVTNDVGPTPAVSGGGWGLVGLRERVTAVGGNLTAGRVDDTHWRLRAELSR